MYIYIYSVLLILCIVYVSGSDDDKSKRLSMSMSICGENPRKTNLSMGLVMYNYAILENISILHHFHR